MTSIRARLLLSMLAALVLAALVIGVITYRNALADAQDMFDYQLRQMALSMRDVGEVAPGDAAALNDEELDFVIQIWTIDGRSVYSSRVHRTLPARTVLGLAEVDVQGERWRTFGVAERGRVIQVAQPVRIRENQAADAALRSVLPLAAAAPVLAAALWWLIALSLKPLARLADQVQARDVSTLQALPMTGLPDEVAPLVVSLNALLARLAEALASQRAFVADAAHELRSPLTALRLQAQLLGRAADEPARTQANQALLAGVDRAARLVEQLLALARHEPGGGAQATGSAMAPVDLGALLRQVLADAAPLVEARAMRVALQSGGDVRPVLGDADALAMLARNLIDNALRYTPAGGQVDVQLAGQGAAVMLRVDDSGPGIPPAERGRVFERFVRGSGAAQASGSGLGLAIAQAIAQRHGARLQLATSPLGGLRVEISLPAAAPDRYSSSAPA